MAIDKEKLSKIKMLVLDVDGVLSDCRLWLDSNNQWKRFYSIRDGVGIKRIIEAGYKVGVITATTAEDVRARVKVLGVHYFYEGATDKNPAFADIQKVAGLRPQEIAYVGDDIFDIPLLTQVGYSVTVPEAVDEVLAVANYITRRPGGNGAVREICDYLYLYGAFSKKG